MSAVSSILNSLFEGASLTGGVVALSQAQASLNTQIATEMHALKSALDLQEATVAALLASLTELGQNIDVVA